jgi:hypothetical protein
VWVAGLALVAGLGIAWLAAFGVGVYHLRIDHSWDFILSFGVVLGFLGYAFVLTVNKFYDWWSDQGLRSILRDVDAATLTPQQRLESLLKDYESRVSLDLSESFKDQLANSPEFKVTLREATKLVLEALAFQSDPHTEDERAIFRSTWQTKLEHFSERVADKDPLAVEIIMKAVEKESQAMPPPAI